jgi:acyl-CoA hydrolase
LQRPERSGTIEHVTESTTDRTPVALLEEVFPGDTNPYGTAFGGKILALMDRAAGLAASRYAHQHFVTASLDAVDFHAPIHQGEIAEVVAQVVYTSRHTCAIQVEVSALDGTRWERRPCCRGTMFMVAIGPDGSPRPVPPLEPASEAERRRWDEAAEVHRRRLERRQARRS